MIDEMPLAALIEIDSVLSRGQHYAVYFANTTIHCRTVCVLFDYGEKDQVLVSIPGKDVPFLMPKTGYTFYALVNGKTF